MTNKELLKENAFLKQKIQELEHSESERKHADAALRESEECFRQLFEHIADGVAVYQGVDEGQDFVFMDINRMGQFLSKIRLDEAVGRRVTEVFPSVERMGLLDVFRRVWRTGQPEHHPLTEYADDRIVQWVENYVFKLSSGLVVVIYSDTSEKRQAEELLRRSEENFRHSLDDSPMGVRIVTVEGESIYANRAILDIYGYDSVEELKTTPTKNRYTSQSYAEFKIRREKRKGGDDGPSEYEISIVRKNGEIRHLQVFRKEILWDGERQFQIIYQDITGRKRAEEDLQESEEKYRNLFENAGEAIFVAQDSNLVFLNPMTSMITGYSADELIKKSFIEFIHPDDRDTVIERYLRRLKGEYIPPDRYSFRIMHRDGNIRWVELNAVLIQWKGKAATLNFLINITERKRMEEDRLERNKKYWNLFNNAEVGMFRTRLDGSELLDMNEKFLQIFSRTREEMQGNPSTIHWANPQEREEMIRRLKAEVRVSDFKCQMLNKRGEVRDCLTSLRAYPELGILEGSIIDVTERKRAEEALKESEERYKQLFENAPAGIYEVDLTTGRILSVNEVICKYTGYTRDELLAINALDLLTEESQKIFIERMAAYAAGKPVPSTLEYQARSKSGREFWMSLNAKYFYKAGVPVRAAVVVYDITNRKQAEEELNTSRLQLRALAVRLQKIREEERVMIAREIHDEMGGGLTGLKMDLSWLLRKMGDADPFGERVALMDKIHTSNALIDQMIHVVRRISTDLRPSVLDDLGLIAALEWQLSEFTSRTEIQHEFIKTFDYVYLEEGTAVAVFRIFQEALTNIVRHFRATKVVIVLLEGERSLFGDESLVLEIRDNGRGITEEEILNKDSLGLLGMKERVQAFGGEFSIYGEPGGGTALILKIPRKRGEPS